MFDFVLFLVKNLLRKVVIFIVFVLFPCSPCVWSFISEICASRDVSATLLFFVFDFTRYWVENFPWSISTLVPSARFWEGVFWEFQNLQQNWGKSCFSTLVLPPLFGYESNCGSSDSAAHLGNGFGRSVAKKVSFWKSHNFSHVFSKSLSTSWKLFHNENCMINPQKTLLQN